MKYKNVFLQVGFSIVHIIFLYYVFHIIKPIKKYSTTKLFSFCL